MGCPLSILSFLPTPFQNPIRVLPSISISRIYTSSENHSLFLDLFSFLKKQIKFNPPFHKQSTPFKTLHYLRTSISVRERERERERNRNLLTPSKMHAKTDSEVTSLAASSPTRSPPRRPVYYVQSPSRDSHDGEKTTTSFHSTPVLSPMGSPPHSHSSVGRHSRESSSTRFSGSLKPGSRKITHKDGSTRGAAAAGRKGQKNWKDCDIIEEEGLLEEEEYQKPLPRRCYFLAFVLGFFVLFSFFSLILWGAARPQKPKVTMKSIKFERFTLSSGSDASGVATEMASVNSTLKFLYRNTATFFGVHVTSSPIDLSYTQITVATGNVNKFYQSRKSQKLVTVSVIGDKIPLYGSSSTLVGTSTGTPTAPVAMNLSFVVRSRAYVLGRLVKPKFRRRIDCAVTFDPKKPNSPISLKKTCTYL